MPFGAWGFESPLAHDTQWFSSYSPSSLGAAAGSSCPLGAPASGGGVGDGEGSVAAGGAEPATPQVRSPHDLVGDVVREDHTSDSSAVTGARGRTSRPMSLDTTTMPERARQALADPEQATAAVAAIRDRGRPAAGGATGSDTERAPTRRGGLQVVPDTPPAQAHVALGQPALASQPEVATPRLDPQDRLVAKPLLAALGWEPTTALTAFVDAGAGCVWVQRRKVPSPSGCDCERCLEEARAGAALPASPHPVGERVVIDNNRRLVLSDGLRHAAGAPPGGQLVAVAFPERHALLLRSTAAAAALLVPADGDAAASEDRTDAAKELA